ncbi:FtsH protease activity modulator HflK [Candidatus Pantoea edessiphila]|uniref:Protein HflK n=1 Tax=Candidatus Pantoea edessiphila TaxID=2044610 RepID=A0A2P5SXS2_9GAMM|nr:FtsH protease activity modulator HflK [Candidatus Pantoea edessiphila]MBK4775728.1 FtsH protease activity modulator HflK [Pantoea sp. Edef]PPI87125.1 FtsH protease activity modulator HflK [Candidatus Pantoea edessiphila]
MVCDHNENNKQDHNPWSQDKNRNNKNKNNRSNLKIYNVVYILKKLINKLKQLGSKSNNTQKYNFVTFKLVLTISASLLAIWLLSGLYTIQEAECGVVTRFGKFNCFAKPGLNWKLNFIDNVKIINTKKIRELNISGLMLTSDENLVYAEVNLNYTIINPKYYLYSVINVEDSLLQATKSSLRNVIGRTSIEDILNKGYSIICDNTKNQIDEVIRPYKMGINIIKVDFRSLNLPDEIQSAFDNVIKAKKNREQSIQKAKSYFNKTQIIARKKAKNIIEEANMYQKHKLLKAESEAKKIAKILAQYKSYPKITKEFLYIEAMKNILNHSTKILVNNKKNQLILIPSDLLSNKSSIFTDKKTAINNINHLPIVSDNTGCNKNKISSNNDSNNIMDQRRQNAIRDDIKREERIHSCIDK